MPVEDFLSDAVKQIREDTSCVMEAVDIVGLDEERLISVFADMVQSGFLPPNLHTPCTGAEVSQMCLLGICVGLRATQLQELAKLDDIPSLDEPIR